MEIQNVKNSTKEGFVFFDIPPLVKFSNSLGNCIRKSYSIIIDCNYFFHNPNCFAKSMASFVSGRLCISSRSV